jgi:hypothetical protein
LKRVGLLAVVAGALLAQSGSVPHSSAPNERIAVLETRVNGIDTRLTSIDIRLAGIESTQNSIQVELKSLNNKVDFILKVGGVLGAAFLGMLGFMLNLVWKKANEAPALPAAQIGANYDAIFISTLAARYPDVAREVLERYEVRSGRQRNPQTIVEPQQR